MNFCFFIRRILPVLCLLLSSVLSPLLADTVFLKNGRRVEGNIVYQDRILVRIRTANGLQAVRRGLIRRLTYGPWNPGTEAQPEEREVQPAPKPEDNYEKRQWWQFQRQSEGLAPNLPPRFQPAPNPTTPRYEEPVYTAPRTPPPTRRAAPSITKEPLKQIFKPRKKDPVTNEPLDRFYFRLGVANGDYAPFLQTTLARAQEFRFLYRQVRRSDEVSRELPISLPWTNPNFSTFPISFRLFLPRAYIAGDYYRSKNSPGFRRINLQLPAGSSSPSSDFTRMEQMRVDRLFRFRGNLRAGAYLVDRPDLKTSLYGGYTTMRIYAKIDSLGFAKSATQNSDNTPPLWDFNSSIDRESNTEVRGPNAGFELSYTAPFDIEFWLRTGAYQLSGNFHSTIREQILTASSTLYKVTHNWAFTEDRHEGLITITGLEGSVGLRFPAGSSRSIFLELQTESFTTRHTDTRAWEWGITRLAGTEYQFKPVFQDRDEVLEYYFLESMLSNYLKAADSFYYVSAGMEFRY